MKLLLILLAFYVSATFWANPAQAQLNENQPWNPDTSVYHVKPWIDIPVTAGAFIANYIGLKIVNAGRLTKDDIEGLGPDDVPWFDRAATRQDPEFSGTAQTISDIMMNGSFAAPFLLLFDRRIRAEGWDYVMLYLETEAVTGNIYSWGAAHVHRKRPLVFNPDVDTATKLGRGTMNSFYSGHAASTATATYFMAKVLCDFHPGLREKKLWVYGAATTIPLAVGVLRFKAGKHFPSDIAAGLVTGAAMGVLIPEIHKYSSKKSVAVVPFLGDFNGLALRWDL